MRSPEGRVLGIFNSETFLAEGGKGTGTDSYKQANFALPAILWYIWRCQGFGL